MEVLWKLFRRFGPKSVRLADLPCATGWSSSLVVLVAIFEAQNEIDIVVRSDVISVVGVVIGRLVHRRRR